MNGKKKFVLAMIVIMIAFSIGFLTFKGAEIVRSFVLGSESECTSDYDGASCSEPQDTAYPHDLPSKK